MTPGEVAREIGIAVGASLGALGVAISVYAFVSFFLLMGRHTPRRAFWQTFRHFLREVWVAGLVQPWTLLYYVLGRRMARGPAKGGGVPVVLVHGYMQNRVGFVGLARALARRGIGPIYGFNYPWFLPIPSNAARLERFVASVTKETGAAKVDLVAHSMGGLVAIEMMRDEAKHAGLEVRRLVTIASPHAGVMWRGPVLGAGAAALRRGSKLLETHAGAKVAVPTLSVFSTHDNVVHPKESSSLALRGAKDVEVEGVGHLAILFDSRVADHVAEFLAAPDAV